MANEGRHAVHRTIVLVEAEGYGASQRTLPHPLSTRAGLYAVVAEALEAAGVPWEACYHEDRGNSVIVLIPPEYPRMPLVETLPEILVRAVYGHNFTSHHAGPFRMRLAVHSGEVAFDEHGVVSPAVTAAFRMIDAGPLKKTLAASSGVLAMIVSPVIFDEVVRFSATLNPATFRLVEVVAEQDFDLAWIARPDHPYPQDPSVLNQRSAIPARPDTMPRWRRLASGQRAAGSPPAIVKGLHYPPMDVPTPSVIAMSDPGGTSDAEEELVVYTSGDDGSPVRDAVVDLLEAAGYSITAQQSPERGSWFQRLSVKPKGPEAAKTLAATLATAVTNELTADTIGAVVQGGHIASVEVHPPRAAYEERMANAIARLLEASLGHEQVVIYMRPILLIKIGPSITVREPTDEEHRLIIENPQLLHSPHDLLVRLAINDRRREGGRAS